MSTCDCPRFHTCNPALCPLVSDRSYWGYHRSSDAVCYYLRMIDKAGAAERFADDPVFAACQERLPEITNSYPGIAKAVAKAAETGFPGGNLPRNRPQERETALRHEGVAPNR